MNYGGIKGTIITADANDKINITENGVIITDKRVLYRACSLRMRCRPHIKALT